MSVLRINAPRNRGSTRAQTKSPIISRRPTTLPQTLRLAKKPAASAPVRPLNPEQDGSKKALFPQLSKKAKIGLLISGQTICFTLPIILTNFSFIYLSIPALTAVSLILMVPILGWLGYGVATLFKRIIKTRNSLPKAFIDKVLFAKPVIKKPPSNILPKEAISQRPKNDNFTSLDKADKALRQLPRTKKFFEKHAFMSSFFKPEKPIELLESLVFPDEIREATEENPVVLEGYSDAVKELGELAFKLARSEKGKALSSRLPLNGIPKLNIPEGLREELERFINSPYFESELEEMVHRGGPDELLKVIRDNDEHNETIQSLYEGQVRGGNRQELPDDTIHGLEKAKNDFMISDDYWVYAMGGIGPEPVEPNGLIGRFYFHVRPEHAVAFWTPFVKMLKEGPFQRPGHEFQAKISKVMSRFVAGDAGLLYFWAKDQQYFFEQTIELFESHKHLFHDARPIFATRLMGRQKDWVHGLSFGQEPIRSVRSFSGIRAVALSNAIRGERFLRIMGYSPSHEDRISLMVDSLQKSAIDINYPAFNYSSGHHGIEVFDYLFQRSAQSVFGPIETLASSQTRS